MFAKRMMLRISVVAQMNVFCFPTIFVVKAAYIDFSVISNMIRDRIRGSLLWGGAMSINSCLYYTGFYGFFQPFASAYDPTPPVYA